MQTGLELLRQGHYAAALPEFEQAEQAYPHNAAIANVLGIINTKLGHLQVANQEYKKAIRLDAKLEEAHKNLGFNYLTEKRYAPAEEQLKIAIGLAPGDAFAHYYLARLYLATYHDQAAVRQLAPSREVLQDDPEASFEMAEACLRLDQTKTSLALIGGLERRSALSVSQESQLAVLLSDRQMYPQSVALFRRIIEEDPQSWTTKYNLAIVLLRIKRPEEALSLLEPLAARRSQDARVLNLLGIAYEAGGKPAQALKAYQRAVRMDPNNPNRYLDYTRLLMDAGRYDESEHLVEAGLNLVPDPYALEIRLGSVQMMMENYGEARESFEAAIKAHPEIALGYVALAQTYLRRQQNQQAATVLAGARRKLPRQFLLEYFYGLALLRLGQKDEAIKVLKSAVALKPDIPEAHFELGQAYLQSNRTGAARNEFECAIQLNPDYADAYYPLARIYARMGDTEKARQMAARTTRLRQQQYDAALKARDSMLNAIRLQQAR
ncbi:MAG TPA: tetratricopeptide repeat protein [Terriglobia bacterium]|nr:tetratricopeptide repeat protein [Terriglobia bacterium]